MTDNVSIRITLAAVILFTTTPLTKADDTGSVSKVKAEKIALEKRVAGVKCLGMTLVEPSAQLLKQYDLPAEARGPIITRVQDRSFFPTNMAPSEGCAFWFIESPANGFLFSKKESPRYQPKTIREFAEAILASTVTPEEYQKLFRQAAEAALKRADALTDKPAERERFLRIAEAKVPAEEAGKSICRVVYHYPRKRGTMTTTIRMTKADLDEVRELFKK